MNIEIKVADKKVKDHYAGTEGRTITNGEKYLQINNGTIGRGRRTFNINKKDAVNLLYRLLEQLDGENEQ